MEFPAVLMDNGVITTLQAITPLTSFFSKLDFLDSGSWYILIIAIVYLAWNPKTGMQIAAVMGIAGGICGMLKLFYHVPRPIWVSTVVSAYAAPASFGYPSAASLYATILYGLIAARAYRWWVSFLCIIMITIVSVSRLFLGVNFLQDIASGVIIGLIILFLLFMTRPEIEGFAKSLGFTGKIIGSLLLAAVPFVLAGLALHSLSGYQVPAEWVQTAISTTGTVPDPISTLIHQGLPG